MPLAGNQPVASFPKFPVYTTVFGA